LKLWYLTRSYYPYLKGGGPLLRKGQADNFKKIGWDIVVVMPNYGSNELKIEDDIHLISYGKNQRIASILERIGIYEDYLDKWVKNTYEYLKDKVKKDDIIFATSGGELGMIKLGSLLKDKISCKFVMNFHDPLDYSIVNGLKLDNKFHISREKQEYKHLKNSDLIITSSKTNQKSLVSKYPQWNNKIFNNYFGYIAKLDINKFHKKVSDKLRIAYVGNMGDLQKPEILYEVYKRAKVENLEVYFIGNSENYKPLQNIVDDNVKFIDFLPHEEFLRFMIENIDIGFVSLTSDYLGACVPSKIYEYINLGLPMIGALPDGDGKDIINNNQYGMACSYDDIDGLINAIKRFQDKVFLENIRNFILNDRDKWFMENRIKELNVFLRELDEN